MLILSLRLFVYIIIPVELFVALNTVLIVIHVWIG